MKEETAELRRDGEARSLQIQEVTAQMQLQTEMMRAELKLLRAQLDQEK